ncbi:MAG: hypothetical protein NXI30_11330 [bacterium]|nr:hypothetical protein [bacterium]
MARIEGVGDQEASFMTKRVFAAAAKEAGAVPDPLRIMAKSSPTMWGAGLLQVSLDRARSVPDRLKTLACLKAASMIGCVF